MSTLTVVVVVNPNAAGGRAGRQWSSLRKEVARALGHDVRLEERITDAPGAATRLTRGALRDGADVVLALGGDGSANDVANGFFEPPAGRGDDAGPEVVLAADDPELEAAPRPVSPQAAFGVLPFGTGGDFRKTLGIPKDPVKAAQRIAKLLPDRDRWRAIDVGRVVVAPADPGDGDHRLLRHFVNIASFGMPAVVDGYVSRSSKLLTGQVTFAVATLRAFFDWRNTRVQLQMDDEEPRVHLISAVAVANGKYFGGGMQVAPAADPTDGALEVTVMGDLGVGTYITQGYRLYDGNVAKVSGVKTYSGYRRVVGTLAQGAQGPVPVEVDGEVCGELPAVVRLYPALLPTLGPKLL